MCELLARSTRQHVFAHNGHLPGIAQSARLTFERYRPIGDTDSEHAFCALLERLHGLWGQTAMPPSVEQRLNVVTQFAADLCLLRPANFLCADGEFLFAHGHRRIHPASGRIEPPGLFRLAQSSSTVEQRPPAHGVAGEPGMQAVTLIASVPLDERAWRPFAEGDSVVVPAGVVTHGALRDSPASRLSHG